MPILCFPHSFFFVHRMSAEEAQFGTESRDDAALVDIPEPSKKKGKGKGGKTKVVNNARGIPETIRKKMGYDTPSEEMKQQRKNRLQGIRRYWAIRWYKYKSIPDWKWAMQFAFSPPFQYTMAMLMQVVNSPRWLPQVEGWM